MTPTLRSARLLLTPYTAADENEFVDLLADPEVARYIGDGPEPAEAQRARFGRLMRDVYPHDRFRVWAVWHGGRYVGHGELKPATVVDGQELVYLVRHK